MTSDLPYWLQRGRYSHDHPLPRCVLSRPTRVWPQARNLIQCFVSRQDAAHSRLANLVPGTLSLGSKSRKKFRVHSDARHQVGSKLVISRQDAAHSRSANLVPGTLSLGSKSRKKFRVHSGARHQVGYRTRLQSASSESIFKTNR